MIGLADCNNFYCSCERVFRPDLIGKPVIVLSNNDGCVIARSEEAKALGYKMGDPFYQVRKKLEAEGVAIFCGNSSMLMQLSPFSSFHVLRVVILKWLLTQLSFLSANCAAVLMPI